MMDGTFIDASKENIRPLRSGRRADSLVALSPAETEEFKAKHEAKIRLLTGSELLDAYYDYIHWFEHHLASTDETNFKALLEKCLDTFFKADDKSNYESDSKLLTIFLKYTSLCNNALELFKSAYDTKFFKYQASFFIEWSYHSEAQHDFRRAKKILQGGLIKKAKPIESLNKALSDIEEREKEYLNDPQLSAQSTLSQRQAFNQLKTRLCPKRGNIAPVDRVSNIIPPLQENRGLRVSKFASSTSRSDQNLAIPTDKVDQTVPLVSVPEGPVNLPFQKQAVPQSIKGNENAIEPGKWNDNKLACGKKTKLKKDGFEVPNDEEEVPVKKSVAKGNEVYYWNHSQLYPKKGATLSFEELRYSYLKKNQKKPSHEVSQFFNTMDTQVQLGWMNDDETLASCSNARQNFEPSVIYEPVLNKIPEDDFEIVADQTTHFVAPKNSEDDFAIPTEVTEAIDIPSTLPEKHIFKAPTLSDTSFPSVPTLRIDTKVFQTHCDTMNLTVSNLETQFAPSVVGISTPMSKKTKLPINPCSPIIEYSYYSSSSSGPYTTTNSTGAASQINLKKFEFSPEDMVHPLPKKVIKTILNSLTTPIEELPGYCDESSEILFKQTTKWDEFILIKNEGFYLNRKNMSTFSGVKLLIVQGYFTSNQNPDVVVLRVLPNIFSSKWDFYIRSEISKRAFENKRKCLLAHDFAKEMIVYKDASVSIADSFLFELLQKRISFVKDGFFFLAFLVYKLIVLIENLHSFKIVCGAINPENILMDFTFFDTNFDNIEQVKFIDILDFSHAIDLAVLSTDAATPNLPKWKLDWIGLRNIIWSALFSDDFPSDFSSKSASNITRFENATVDSPHYGKLFADFILSIEETYSNSSTDQPEPEQPIHLEKHKLALLELLKTDRVDVCAQVQFYSTDRIVA